MPEYKIINVDQMIAFTHLVQAPDRETAMKRFKAGHYGSIIECEEVKPEVPCPHCGKNINKIV